MANKIHDSINCHLFRREGTPGGEKHDSCRCLNLTSALNRSGPRAHPRSVAPQDVLSGVQVRHGVSSTQLLRPCGHSSAARKQTRRQSHPLEVMSRFRCPADRRT